MKPYGTAESIKALEDARRKRPDKAPVRLLPALVAAIRGAYR